MLKYMLEEEEALNQLVELAREGNFQEMSIRGLLLPRLDPDFSNYELYATLFSSISQPKHRPRVFAMQMNIYYLVSVMLTELLLLE